MTDEGRKRGNPHTKGRRAGGEKRPCLLRHYVAGNEFLNQPRIFEAAFNDGSR